MILAKLALGFGGTVVLAGAYTFHDGVVQVRVQEKHSGKSPIHVWAPAALAPMALHVVPREKLAQGLEQAAPFLPTFRALTQELKNYPDAEFVDVRDHGDHVRIGVHGGKLLIDVDNPEEQVQVTCPLAVLEDISYELESKAPPTV